MRVDYRLPISVNEACEKYNMAVNRVFQMSPLSSVSQDTHTFDETRYGNLLFLDLLQGLFPVMFLKSLQREALRECPNLSSLEARDTFCGGKSLCFAYIDNLILLVTTRRRPERKSIC